MKVLNLYAGIGGNRKLWTDVEVTAVEWREDIAAVYRDYSPQDKFIKEFFPDCEVHHYIGFDFGESRRVIQNPLENHINHYPLIEWKWDRKKCEQIIIDAGLCIPEKSSCWFCPNMRKFEILRLPDNLKERVKFIESNAKNKVELKGLGRNYSWTDLINADESQQKLFDDLDMYNTPCHCTT